MAISNLNRGSGIISVSVIIPVYNTDKYLSEAIQSVLDQSLREFELILINDGSTDNSAKICHDYTKKDDRVKYFKQSNSGVSAARNLGLLCARGKYVFFMDSDDTIDQEFLATSYDASEQQGNDITILGEYYCKRGLHTAALPTCAQFLRLDFLHKHPDIRFPEGIQPCEDGLFSHRLLALTWHIGENPKAIYHYRIHENQNHRKINKNCDSVLRQIPQWRIILEDFYDKYHLQKKKSLHLAHFIEHEPFELRYLGMPLSMEQKSLLHGIIKSWMVSILPYLSKEEIKMLSRPFIYFLLSRSAADFDRFFRRYQHRRKLTKKVYLFLIRFIFLKKIRRKLRVRVNEKM